MARHHLIISGADRAGTTFFVRRMTELGLNTELATSTSEIVIDHALVPVRDVSSAAHSRRDVVTGIGSTSPPALARR
jgi:hypothetical protein